jgi:tellurite resistance protein TehA-like permease
MKTGTFVAMIFLVLVAIAHILRVIWQVEVIVDDYYVPMWMSYTAVILAAVLAGAMWNEHRSK